MKFQDYADGAKFILQTDLFAIDHHSYQDSFNVLTREEMEEKVHVYAHKGTVWTLNKADQVIECDGGDGSLGVLLDAEVDAKMWEFWDHTYQSGLNHILVTYCTNYNGCHIQCDEDEDNLSDEVSDKLDQLSDAISINLNDLCNDDGDFIGDESDAEEIIITLTERILGTNAQVSIEFDHFST